MGFFLKIDKRESASENEMEIKRKGGGRFRAPNASLTETLASDLGSDVDFA